jgi:predicted O-linked N-acetylglucosamine transferase (SPINDLY family)
MATVPATFATALQHYDAGRPAQAEQLLRLILQANPRHVDALHLLGLIAHQAGRHDLAVNFLRQVVGLRPRFAEAHSNLGIALAGMGKLDESIAAYRQALEYKPDFSEAYNNLGGALKTQGKYDEAIQCYQQAVHFQPDYADAYNNLGNVLKAQDKTDEAVAAYTKALQANPSHAGAHNNLGNALRSQGKLPEAISCYEQALRLAPDNPNHLINLGVALSELGKPAEGLVHCQQAVRLQPNNAAAHNSLGVVFQHVGELDHALVCFQQALRLKPDYAEAYSNMGNVRNMQGKVTEARACYEEAIRLKPDFAMAHNNLGGVLRVLGLVDDAIATYHRAMRLRPHYPDANVNLALAYAEKGEMDLVCANYEEAARLLPTAWNRILPALVLPAIYSSLEELQRWRQRLIDRVAALRRDQVVYTLTNEVTHTLFFLPYHGLNDRDIQREVAGLYAAPNEDLPFPPQQQPSGKIKLGFISRHLRNHTIARLNHGLIAQLSRDDFAVTALAFEPGKDELANFIRAHVDTYVELPLSLAAARRLVAQQGLDVLFYLDIGMEPMSFSLAFSRLAPVQCVTWGHPVTTGIPTIDYFISAEHLETTDSTEHYTETLVRLPVLAIYYYRPEQPSPLKSRAEFGLPDDAHLYACPQSFFKFHPDFDAVLGAILRRDPQGLLILLKGHRAHYDDVLMNRFRAHIPDVVDRIRFLPRQDRAGFLSLNIVTDVLLDPIHFGGGNTSYEGLAFGVPIVTLPSGLLRGRITYALYQQMGVLDCVALSLEEYVDLAVRLGTDPAYRDEVRAKILAANSILYENPQAVRALETFLKQALARARSPAGSRLN